MGTPQVIDLSKILAPYRGQWVAMSHDETRVLASGNTLKDVLDAAKRKGESRPLILKVPDESNSFFL